MKWKLKSVLQIKTGDFAQKNLELFNDWYVNILTISYKGIMLNEYKFVLKLGNFFRIRPRTYPSRYYTLTLL
jgi:hypothetical protein